jgi:hypothetical protein
VRVRFRSPYRGQVALVERHGVQALSGGVTGRSFDRLIALARALGAPPVARDDAAGEPLFSEGDTLERAGAAEIAR